MPADPTTGTDLVSNFAREHKEARERVWTLRDRLLNHPPVYKEHREPALDDLIAAVRKLERLDQAAQLAGLMVDGAPGSGVGL